METQRSNYYNAFLLHKTAGVLFTGLFIHPQLRAQAESMRSKFTGKGVDLTFLGSASFDLPESLRDFLTVWVGATEQGLTFFNFLCPNNMIINMASRESGKQFGFTTRQQRNETPYYGFPILFLLLRNLFSIRAKVLYMTRGHFSNNIEQVIIDNSGILLQYYHYIIIQGRGLADHYRSEMFPVQSNSHPKSSTAMH